MPPKGARGERLLRGWLLGCGLPRQPADEPQHDVQHDAGCDAVVDGEGHQHDRHKGGDGDAHVVPSNAPARLHHEGACDDQRCGSRKVGDGREEGREEGRERKQHRNGHRREAGSGSIKDAGAALVRDDQRAGAQQARHHGAECRADHDEAAPGHGAVPEEAGDAVEPVLHARDVAHGHDEHDGRAQDHLGELLPAPGPAREVHREHAVEARRGEEPRGRLREARDPAADADGEDAN
mmetsp:Transcript_122516/g.357752  ORF Transcript_122516/g.357752 Transcript_122516/m.357752 type:complete len:237 (-) Transcript_122516:886-1596(-)